MRSLISYSWLPIGTALVIMAVYVPFSRDLMLLVLTIPHIFVLLCISVLSSFLTFLQVRNHEKASAAPCLAAAIVALAGIPTLVVYGDRLRDPFWFLIWSITHRGQIEALADKDGVIQPWDGWGFAGMENYSYLVSDPRDAIAGLEAANQWAQDHKLACEIVATQRMRRAYYILTTYNCGFVDPPPR